MKLLRELLGSIIVAIAIMYSSWASNACYSADLVADSVALNTAEAQRNLARKQLSCPGVTVEFRHTSEMQARTVDGRYVTYAGLFHHPERTANAYVVWINEQVYRMYSQRLRLHVIQHELVHCARYEHRKVFGIAQPPGMDPSEEMWTESITLELLNDLDADPK